MRRMHWRRTNAIDERQLPTLTNGGFCCRILGRHRRHLSRVIGNELMETDLLGTQFFQRLSDTLSPRIIRP